MDYIQVLPHALLTTVFEALPPNAQEYMNEAGFYLPMQIAERHQAQAALDAAFVGAVRSTVRARLVCREWRGLLSGEAAEPLWRTLALRFYGQLDGGSSWRARFAECALACGRVAQLLPAANAAGGEVALAELAGGGAAGVLLRRALSPLRENNGGGQLLPLRAPFAARAARRVAPLLRAARHQEEWRALLKLGGDKDMMEGALLLSSQMKDSWSNQTGLTGWRADGELDALAEAVLARCGGGGAVADRLGAEAVEPLPLARVQQLLSAVNTVLFEQQGYAGNEVRALLLPAAPALCPLLCPLLLLCCLCSC